MNVQAHAKINLSLDITGLTDNGYHLVKMVMQSLELCDDIELIKAPENEIRLTVTDLRGKASGDHGKNIPADKDNLMYRAAEMILKEAGVRGGVQMHLTKRIPAAAGLAGGSADAAAVFNGINALYELGFSKEKLMDMGVRLGADIPYCIMGGTALAEGIGERLTRIDFGISCYVLLVKPSLGLSTPEVYRAYDKAERDGLVTRHPDVSKMVSALSSVKKGEVYAGNADGKAADEQAAIRAESAKMICGELGNVLEYAVIPSVPLISRIKRDMLRLGAEGTLMTGSGSTVFGLFSESEAMHKAAAGFSSMDYADCLSDIIETKFI
ncbi:MAG: 4-(cytidine 5'-diphospho)-2-C-methyl-D-erythritol kinase [Eubacteriales bacterium]|nr:4-(cytidine 5'-diphospho)-2-C-methyl-D-erythritol kinase [Eubacteriales bacterium]